MRHQSGTQRQARIWEVCPNTPQYCRHSLQHPPIRPILTIRLQYSSNQYSHRPWNPKDCSSCNRLNAHVCASTANCHNYYYLSVQGLCIWIVSLKCCVKFLQDLPSKVCWDFFLKARCKFVEYVHQAPDNIISL